jgi:hypothetical protein
VANEHDTGRLAISLDWSRACHAALLAYYNELEQLEPAALWTVAEEIVAGA